MDMISVGINHKSSAIDVREKFFLRKNERELLLCLLKNSPSVVEAFVLSTCNRTEIYSLCIDNDPDILIQALFKIKKISPTSELNKHFYIYREEKAIKHLLKVVTGMDSLILGEKQILGQIKEAIDLARVSGMMGRTLNIIANAAVRAGKKSQTETQIGYGGSSVSWAAVTKAQEAMGSLQNKSILLVGAGKMGQLTAAQLGNKGPSNIFIMNRDQNKAHDLALQVNGTVVPSWNIKQSLSQIDCCIVSACAPHYIITYELVREVMQLRNQKKLLFIDISVPRNIEPRINELDNVESLTVDDLDKVIEKTLEKRQAAVPEVQRIISNKMAEIVQKFEKIRQINSAACIFETVTSQCNGSQFAGI